MSLLPAQSSALLLPVEKEQQLSPMRETFQTWPAFDSVVTVLPWVLGRGQRSARLLKWDGGEFVPQAVVLPTPARGDGAGCPDSFARRCDFALVTFHISVWQYFDPLKRSS